MKKHAQRRIHDHTRAAAEASKTPSPYVFVDNEGETSIASTRYHEVDLWVRRCADLRAELTASKIRHERELHEETELRRRAEQRVKVLEITLATHDYFLKGTGSAPPIGFIQTHTGEEQ